MSNVFFKPLFVSDICEKLDGSEYSGEDIEILSISDISSPSDYSLCEYTKGELPNQSEKVVLLTQNNISGYNCIIVDNSKKSLINIINKSVFKKLNGCISPSAKIGNNCIIDDAVEIGDNSVIEDGVVIKSDTIIGKNCIIRSNCTIGSEGYSFYYDNEYVAIPSLGGVRINDNVEIGSGCNISKGNFQSTIIGRGTKMDALNHIAHDCIIGDDCTITASVALCGYVKIGSNTRIAPNASILQRKNVGENAVIGLGSVVVTDVPKNATYFGNPARKVMK